MTKLTEILQDRFRKKEKPKMNELAEKSAGGHLTPFSGLFGLSRPGEEEKQTLHELLLKYVVEEQLDITHDLDLLLAITCEVKAITNQAALLHGERIKKAQLILKNYREGAFTAWLKSAYGNRQTPYNLLQYYEFYLKIPKMLQHRLETMPRQAVYTLASREGDLEKKEEVVRNYKGESKQEMVFLIRTLFPLKEDDRRGEDLFGNTLKQLDKIAVTIQGTKSKLSFKEKELLVKRLDMLIGSIKG